MLYPCPNSPHHIPALPIYLAEPWSIISSLFNWIRFRAETDVAGELPAEVFSGVADNLIRNLAEKHLREPDLRAEVTLKRNGEGVELTVCDSGSVIAQGVLATLFVGPVSSESGYGIGLYHAARYAEAAGYRLQLAENRPGRVCFRLAVAT